MQATGRRLQGWIRININKIYNCELPLLLSFKTSTWVYEDVSLSGTAYEFRHDVYSV